LVKRSSYTFTHKKKKKDPGKVARFREKKRRHHEKVETGVHTHTRKGISARGKPSRKKKERNVPANVIREKGGSQRDCSGPGVYDEKKKKGRKKSSAGINESVYFLGETEGRREKGGEKGIRVELCKSWLGEPTEGKRAGSQKEAVHLITKKKGGQEEKRKASPPGG